MSNSLSLSDPNSWYEMGSPYDLKSVMHYTAYSFQTEDASNAGLATITDLNGNPVQWPRVSRMSSEDCFQEQFDMAPTMLKF